MTLEYLLNRATASEHVLITTVAKLIEKEATKVVSKRALDFLTKNPVPARDDFGGRDQLISWAKRFSEALTEESK
jgi:hypothetical protein